MVVGCLITDIVAFFIVVACGATLYVRAIHSIADAAFPSGSWSVYVKMVGKPSILNRVSSPADCRDKDGFSVAPEVLQPSKHSLDFPAPTVSTQTTSILCFDSSVATVRGNYFNAVMSEVGVKFV